MVETNSETEPGKQSRMRGIIYAFILLALFGLIYCMGFYGGRAIKGRFMSAAICTRDIQDRRADQAANYCGASGSGNPAMIWS